MLYPISVVAQTRDGASVLTAANLQRVARLTRWAGQQHDVSSVEGLLRPPTAAAGSPVPSTQQLVGLYSTGAYRQVPALAELAAATASGNTTVLKLGTTAPLDSPTGKALIDHLRARSGQDGLQVLVGGFQATSLDLDRILYRNFPYTILFIAGTTFVLLLISFRSLLLPLKAILMDALSVAATFGVLVHLFQWGDLGLFKPEAFIDALTPILLFCVLFGLSMDYEVFLLSRMREAWLHTPDNTRAVTRGLEDTAGVITGAAVLFILVTGAFAFAVMETTQEVGVGMAVAVLVDSTVIRLLLVPATMRLLGRWNWWLPGRPLPTPQLPGMPGAAATATGATSDSADGRSAPPDNPTSAPASSTSVRRNHA